MSTVKLPVETVRSLNHSELTQLTAFACELADAAGAAIMPHFRNEVSVENKPGRGSFDPVTVADRAAETAMREIITQRYPEHGVLGEEHGYLKGTSGLTWVLDPIDGTRAFISGIPLWGTLIGLYDGEKSVIGIADQPYLRERYIGSPVRSELQTRSEVRPLKTRSCTRLADATLMSTDPDIFNGNQEKMAFYSVVNATRLTRYGGDCYGYCMLAGGFVDVVVESGLEPYDIQALVPVIENAGGCVTNWRGGKRIDNGQVIAVGCESLLEEVVALLRQASID